MSSARNDLKAEIIKRNRRLLHAAAGLSMEYGQFVSILNGFRPMPEDFESRLKAVFEKWDSAERVTA